MKKQLFMVTTAMVLTIQIKSQTIINAGPVSGTWTASGSPYHIMGDINVPAGNTLIIEPGVAVKIYSELSFTVHGQLLAEGTAANHISFLPNVTYWKGLQMINTSDTCKLTFCFFSGFINRTPIDSDIKGGVIYCTNSKINLKNCNFSNNKIENNNCSGSGGAVYSSNTVGNVKNCNFSLNGISTDGGGAFGGAIYSIANSITFDNNFISDNFANGRWSAKGGGVYISGGAFNSNRVINNGCQSYDGDFNPGGYAYAECKGGGLFAIVNVIKDNLISGNECSAEALAGYDPWSIGSAEAEAYGGGIYVNGVIENCIITDNFCYANADIINYGTGTEVIQGGGAWSNSNILNSTIVLNSGYEGSGVYGGNLKNCIVFNNETYNNPQLTGSATYSCIEGGYGGQGNISSDPLFIEGPSGEYYLSQTEAGQGQQSPCVNAGDSASSLIIGTTRTDELVDTGIVDMGFHYHCEPKVLANFNITEHYGKIPFNIQFTDNTFYSQCSPALRIWDFENDGIADSFEEDPTWTYSQPGNYSVSLIVLALDANNEFITDTILKESCIHAFMLNSDFLQDLTYGPAPLPVNFFDASDAVNTELIGWQWDFENDGIIDSYEQNPAFTYSEPGIYSVMLIIQDSSLVYSDTALKEELITICNLQPGFYANPLSGVSPLEVQFYDTTKVEFTQIGTWEWDFNDDGIIDSQEQNPHWTFDQIGKFSIRLIVRDTSQTIVKFLTKEDYVETFSSGIESNTSDFTKSFRIFPNPFTNELIIEADLEKNEAIDISVYDVNFRLMKKIVENENAGKDHMTWKWENKNGANPPGVYYISLTTGTGNQYLKKCIKIE